MSDPEENWTKIISDFLDILGLSGLPFRLAGLPAPSSPFLLQQQPGSLHNLSRNLSPSGKTNIFLAREDLNSGLAFGRNKTRKLEYVIPHVLASVADTIVAEFSLQSNHTRQTAAIAAHIGFTCITIHSLWTESK